MICSSHLLYYIKVNILTYQIYTVLGVMLEYIYVCTSKQVLNSCWYDVCTDFYHTVDWGRSNAFIAPYAREPAAFIYAKAGSSISSVSPATQTIGNVLFQRWSQSCVRAWKFFNDHILQNISLTSARNSSRSVNDASAVTHYPIGTIDTCIEHSLARGLTLPENSKALLAL